MTDIFTRWFKQFFTNPQAIVLTFLLVLIFAMIWLFGSTVMPLLLALGIAYILDWLVSALVKRGLPPIASVLIVFLAFLGLVFGVTLGVIPLVSEQLENLFRDLPAITNKIKVFLMKLPEKYPDLITYEELYEIIDDRQFDYASLGNQLWSFSLASFKNVVAILIYMILVPVLVFFFLKDKQLLLSWISRWLPKDRQLSEGVWQEVDQQLGAYARGKILEIFIVGGVSYIVFIIFNLNYALLLAILVGISVLIPYIGATVVTIPVALVGLLQFGLVDTFWYLIIAYLIIQALDGNVLVPLLFSEANNLHPVAIIAAVLFFGGIWGVWGVFFAIPLATLVVAVVRAFQDIKAQTNAQPQLDSSVN